MRLLYFTEWFPTGVGEPWKYHEINAFSEFFDQVVVVPFGRKDGAIEKYQYRSNVTFAPALIEPWPLGGVDVWSALFKPAFLMDRRVWSELFRCVVRLDRRQFASALHFLRMAQLALGACERRGLLKDQPDTTVLYFFWGNASAVIVPFLPRRYAKVVVGFHGSDLYECLHENGRIPFRRDLLDCADVIAPCSDHGARYLRRKYPEYASKVFIKRLGVANFGISEASGDGILRIVSCAFVVPLKRLELIAKTIALCRQPVEWTHIGGGDGLRELESLTERLIEGQPASARFLGSLLPRQVADYYASNKVDLFVSLSSQEGVPVSIMEALSAGVPVFATDVGGVAEIVDDEVGQLLPADIDPAECAARIDAFAALKASERAVFRTSARGRWNERCNEPGLSRYNTKALFSDILATTDSFP